MSEVSLKTDFLQKSVNDFDTRESYCETFETSQITAFPLPFTSYQKSILDCLAKLNCGWLET